MTKTLKSDRSNHTTFAGILYPSDFNTSYPGGNLAKRIARDRKFDEECLKNYANRQRMQKGGAADA